MLNLFCCCFSCKAKGSSAENSGFSCLLFSLSLFRSAKRVNKKLVSTKRQAHIHGVVLKFFNLNFTLLGFNVSFAHRQADNDGENYANKTKEKLLAIKNVQNARKYVNM
jgi:hypothetical protein